MRYLYLSLAVLLILCSTAYAAVNSALVDDWDGTYALQPGTQIDARVLAANTAETHTVPSGATKVLFSPNASCVDFYVNFTTTATVPSADVTDGSASVANPTKRQLAGISTFSIISPNACIVTLEFLKDKR